MFRIAVLFIVGIVLQEFVQFNSYLVLSIWLGLLVLLIFTAIEKSKSFLFHRLISIQLYLLFFVGGMLALGSTSQGFYKSHFSTHFLSGDQVIARVSEFNEGQNNFDKALLEVEQIVNSSTIKKVDGTLLAYIEKGEKQLSSGQVIVFRPTISGIENKGNPGEFDAKRYWKTKGITSMVFIRNAEFLKLTDETISPPFFDRLRAFLKNELNSKLSPAASSLAIALSLGDKGGLSQETRDSFSNAGAMHVLAVSGLHVGILLGIVQWIFFQVRLLRRRNTYILCAIVILWVFALLTGLAPSVFRATLMFSVLGLGQLLGKRFFSLNALIVSAVLLLMLDAKILFDIGFQLSYLALLGITFFFQPISNLISIKNKWLNKLWEGTALGLAAQIGTIPISLYYFHQFPNYFILTNLGLILVSGIALGSVLLFFVSSKTPVLSDVIAQGMELIFASMQWFVKSIDQLPFSVARGFSLELWQVLLAYFSIVVLLFAYQKQIIRAWYLAVFMVFLCAVNFIYVRHSSEFKNETIVFNSASPLILFKNGGNNFFFHTTEDKSELEKLDFIVASFEKKFGGKSSYVLADANSVTELKNRNKTIFTIENKLNILYLSDENKSAILPLSDNFRETGDAPIIAGSWIKNLQKTEAKSLKKGAMRW
jgi:competence protein ComEC